MTTGTLEAFSMEIACDDDDIASFEVIAYDDLCFIKQAEQNTGATHAVMVGLKEASQIIAGLRAFVEGKLTHTSHCALYNGPATAAEPCNCGSEGSEKRT